MAFLATTSPNVISARPQRTLVVVDAPSNLGLKPPPSGGEPGVKDMARVLRAHGLVSRLGAESGGAVVPPRYTGETDRTTGIRNAKEIREYSVELAARLDPLLRGERFPILVGGDCSILLGAALGLHRLGDCGLLFIDGHSDLLTPATSESKGAGGMDLALVTGTGPPELTQINTDQPYIRPGNVVVFGYRWPEPDESSPASPAPPMTALPLSALRRIGVRRGIRTAVARLERCSGGFWTHLDVDVLAPEWMSAVDSPDPGGMNPEELEVTLTRAVRSVRCVGMSLSIYDPSLDPQGVQADLIVRILARAFERT